MAIRYLLHFAHEHLTFRWTEFLALTSRNNCKFKLISDVEHIKTRPYILIELDENSTEDSLIESAKGSYLLKDLYELWAQSDDSVDDLSLQAAKSPQFLSRNYARPDQSFRINVESFGSKLLQSAKHEMIQKLDFMDTFEARPNLTQPRQTYCIFEFNELANGNLQKEYYFGRHLASTNRANIDVFSLKKRIFIANTSMDPKLSLISANAAKVKPNDIVYDPFVGSGSMIVAAAHMGAYVCGGDIDWKLLHGKSRPSRKGQHIRASNECVRANFRQYDLEDRYIDVLVSDITRSPLRDDLIIDAIISDPPYGVRECSEKIGAKRAREPINENQLRFPSKISYQMSDLLSDLLMLSAKHLTIGGRLVYYLPVTNESCDSEKFIPRHPCLKLVSYCQQGLTSKVSRFMIVMEKVRHLRDGDKSEVPQIISDMNLRETYFSSSGMDCAIKCT